MRAEKKGNSMGKRLFCVLILLLALNAPAFASGFTDTYGIGMRAIALGGAFSAVADDYSAAFYNPAGLGQIEGHQVAAEVFYTSPQIEVNKLSGGKLVIYDAMGNVRTDPGDASGGTDLNLMIPMLGAVLDINRIAKLPFNVKFGVAGSMPEQGDISYRMNDWPPDQPHFIRYGDDIDRITLAIGVGAEAIKDILYVGAGAQAMLYGSGNFYVDHLSETLKKDKQDVVLQAEFGPLFEFDPTAGVLLTLMDKRLKIGASWRDEQELRLEPIAVNALVYIGDAWEVMVPMVLDICAFYTPEERSLGFAWDDEKFMVSLEVNQQLWSEYEYSKTDQYHYKPGAPGIVGKETGSPDFDDTLNYRLGLEVRPMENMSVMLGYAHQPTPVPDQSGRVSNYLDMDKETLTAGASYTFENVPHLKAKLKLAGTLMYQVCDDYKVDKTGVSGPSWPNQESYEVEGDVFAGGVSASFAW